jgi:hypothetical protein
MVHFSQALKGIEKTPWRSQHVAATRCAASRWHMGCIDKVTDDFVCKCGLLIRANGNAAGTSAHLTPPAVGAECRQRLFLPGIEPFPGPQSTALRVLE